MSQVPTTHLSSIFPFFGTQGHEEHEVHDRRVASASRVRARGSLTLEGPFYFCLWAPCSSCPCVPEAGPGPHTQDRYVAGFEDTLNATRDDAPRTTRTDLSPSSGEHEPPGQSTKLPMRCQRIPLQSSGPHCLYESQMKSALPLMFSSGTEPHTRESFELLRLSPITNTCPRGTL
jgi:hypothetical protein